MERTWLLKFRLFLNTECLYFTCIINTNKIGSFTVNSSTKPAIISTKKIGSFTINSSTKPAIVSTKKIESFTIFSSTKPAIVSFLMFGSCHTQTPLCFVLLLVFRYTPDLRILTCESSDRRYMYYGRGGSSQSNSDALGTIIRIQIYYFHM